MPDRRQDITNPDRLEVFERHRRLLLSIAYSILGSREEAEESLEKTRDHWLQVPDPEFLTAKAFLVTKIASVSLDRLQVTYQLTEQIESCPYSDANEPSVASSTPSPASAASASWLALMALDGLAPEERSAFLLRKIFKYRYSEIGRIFDKDEQECRRSVSKAKKSIAKNRSTLDLLKEE